MERIYASLAITARIRYRRDDGDAELTLREDDFKSVVTENSREVISIQTDVLLLKKLTCQSFFCSLHDIRSRI